MTLMQIQEAGKGSLVMRIVLVVTSASLVIATFVQHIIGVLHGLDISDEGMYLLSAERPTKQSAFHNPFGDYTGLLFKLSFHQVWLFRLIGVLLLAIVGSAVSSAVYRIMRKGSATFRHQFFFALTGTLIVPFYYAIGLFTPSYNWLNLFSLCLGLASIINLINPDSGDAKFTAARWSIAFSTSVWLGTFAKLSTGPGLLALLTVAFIVCRPNFSRVRIVGLTCVCTALLLALFHSLFISPLSIVITKLTRGQKALTVFDPRYDVSAAISDFMHGGGKWLTFTFRDEWNLILVSAILAIAIFFLRDRLQLHRALFQLATCFVSIIPILWFFNSQSQNLWSGNDDHYSSQVLAVSHIITAVAIAIPLLIALRPIRPLASELITPLLLLGAVSLYGFGSNNGFVEQITGAVGLLALFAISIAFLAKTVNVLAVVTALLLLLGGYFTTISQKSHPYRQVPQSKQTQRIEIQKGAGPLFVDPRLAQNILDLRSQLAQTQWKSRTPLLDLTQYSAGIVFALNGKPPVTIIPTVGGMENVDALASWSFDYISEHQTKSEWTNAWLLLPNPDNGRECVMCPNTQVLSKLNRAFPTDYSVIAKSQDFVIYQPITKR